MWQKTVDAFLDSIACDSPTPGGGAVSAVTAAFGLGLVIMALEVSKRKAEGDRLVTIQKLIADSRKLLSDLKLVPDKDSAAFDGYMAALKVKGEQLQRAIIVATEIPLQAAKLMKYGIEIADQSEAVSSKNILSDVLAGRELLRASLRAVLLNVDINAPYIKDELIKDKFIRERNSYND